jgi:hypothetical protein
MRTAGSRDEEREVVGAHERDDLAMVLYLVIGWGIHE